MNIQSIFRNEKYGLLKVFATIYLALCQGEAAEVKQALKVYRDQNDDVRIEWFATHGYTYVLQRSNDLVNWFEESSWIGFGQEVEILVRKGDVGGGGQGEPNLPQHNFSIARGLGGGSLIGWKGADGLPYQFFSGEEFFGDDDAPLFLTEVSDPSGDYLLFLHQSIFTFPPDVSSYTLAALPEGERDKVQLLISARQQIISELAGNIALNSQTALSSGSADDANYFRLQKKGYDPDGDGLHSGLEADFNLNPYDPDTDHDGVTDPWDHAGFSDIIVSEFMASNNAFGPDQFGEYGDYIELFNPTPVTRNLDNYFLSNKKGILKNDGTLKNSANLGNDAWRIPDGLDLSPGESIVIYASEKNLSDATKPLHTNFKLDADGDDVILISSVQWTSIDAHLKWGEQRLNTSAGWGLNPDTGLITKLHYFLDPTPGDLNNPSICKGLSKPPTITAKGGVFSYQTFSTTIIPNDSADIVHYTLDSSDPTVESPIYNGEILEIDSTTILRAVAVRLGCPPSAIVSRSYLFKEDIVGTGGHANPAVDYQVKPQGYPGTPIKDQIPIRVGSIDDPDNPLRDAVLDFSMNPEVVSQHYDNIRESLSELPTISLTMPVESLFGTTSGIYARSDDTGGRGTPLPDPKDSDWNRLASFEYIDPEKPNYYRQENCEVAISGASTREHGTTGKHNFKLRFKSKFSLEGNDKMKFSNSEEDDVFEGTPLREFKQIQLRNPGQDSWSNKFSRRNHGFEPDAPENGEERSFWNAERAVYVRDAWSRAVHRRMNPPEIGLSEVGNWVAHRQWVHLYLNGLYWGVYDMSERIDEHFARAYGNPHGAYDIISQGDSFGAPPKARAGTEDRYLDLLDYCEEAGQDPSNSEKWMMVESLLDINNYIDYILVNLFSENRDWPANNWRAIRQRPPLDDDGKETEEHRFKFLIWDAEMGFIGRRKHRDRLKDPSPGVVTGPLAIHHSLKEHSKYILPRIKICEKERWFFSAGLLYHGRPK